MLIYFEKIVFDSYTLCRSSNKKANPPEVTSNVLKKSEISSTQPKRLTVNQMSVCYRFCHFVALIEFK